MKKLFRVISIILFWGSSIALFVFYFISMSSWLGFIGGLLAFVLFPGIIIFPILFWIIEGVFPILYFIFWGIGILNMLISILFFKKE